MKFHAKDPGSALTHFLGVLFSVAAAVPLIVKASHTSSLHAISMAIFMGSMFLLYTASTVYHTLDISDIVNTRLKKMDHMMICVLIAGSYTPICMIVLDPPMGYLLCAVVWTIAIVGMIIKLFWVYCPKWFSSVLYIAMGWLCLMAFGQLIANLSASAFGWLLAGGILYTVGGVIYALKLPIFNARHKNFGSHEVFHLFVLAGSLCHYILMFVYVSNMSLS